MAQPRVSEAERNRRAYWAQRRARERGEQAGRQSNDPRHPHNHRCTERTIDYGQTEHVCHVCGRIWRLEEFAFGPKDTTQVGLRYRAIPLTQRLPPYRKEYDR